ncbi:MAG TPA: hypothetical protein VGZ22_21955 [Isosphaeraceae bacterium]|jgi:hypothetical protein|nr:hypothetical protein [Isosphaeraceae bacterium]
MIAKRTVMAASIAMLALVCLAADEPKQTIDAKGLSFDVPKTWKSSTPSSSMRAAQLNVDPAEGDTEPAELVLFVFPGGAGGVDANVKRWQEQFKDKDGKPPKVTRETRKGKNTDVTYVEVAGRYVAAVRPGSPQTLNKPDFRLMGAIVETPDSGYFLKMVGPEKTMKAAKPAFDNLIASIRVAGK